jgi:hypothetical protein
VSESHWKAAPRGGPTSPCPPSLCDEGISDGNTSLPVSAFLILLKEEGTCRAVAMNVVALTERADLSITKKSCARVFPQDFLKQARVMTLAAKKAGSSPGAGKEQRR